MDTKYPTVFLPGKSIDLCVPYREGIPTITPMVNDREITKHLTIFAPMPLENEYAWYERIIKRPTNEYVFFLVTKEKRELIGSMGIHAIDHRLGIATTGAVIGSKAHQGKGYGTEAKMLLLHWAFTELNLRKVYSSVKMTNPRSRAYLEKTGYRKTGVRHAHDLVDGEFVDIVDMELFCEWFMPLWEEYQRKL